MRCFCDYVSQVFNVRPKTTLLPVRSRDAKSLDPPDSSSVTDGDSHVCDQRTPLIFLYFTKTNWGRKKTHLVWPTGSLRGSASRHAESPALTDVRTVDRRHMCDT